jgi:plasmid stability protein
MSDLHVRNVPEDVYEGLRRRAKELGTSISVETVRLLRRALKTDSAEVRELLEEIEQNRPVARGEVPSAAELIRQDRDAQ